MEKIDLFCLPFAGGNKYSYREYEENAPPFLNIIPMEYPGRGARINEPLVCDINWLVSDLYGHMQEGINQRKYAIYGHSMGGLIAFLLAKKIIKDKRTPPMHLFITGTTGPSAVSREEKRRHLLEKKEFIEELKKLKGSPDEILENDELLNYYEPILRADFKASELFIYEESDPVNIPITVITGSEEDFEIEDVHLWQKETRSAIDFKRIPGSHFFIFEYPATIIEVISKKLLFAE